MPLLPLQLFITGSEPDSKEGNEKKASSSKKDREHLEEALEEMPWLSAMDTLASFSVEGSEGKHRRVENVVDVEADEGADVALMESLAALDKARAALVGEAGVDEEHFGIKARGGTSQFLATGEALHAAQGVAKTAEAEDFCKRRSLQKTFKCTFSTHTYDASMTMVRGWVHKMSYFLRLEEEQPGTFGQGLQSS